MGFCRIAAALAGLLGSSPALAIADINNGFPDQDFTECVTDIGERAIEAGVSADTVHAQLEQVRFVDRVIELDRSQPEFTSTFADYFDRRVTERRVERGRELLAEHGPLLENLAAEYGVPPQYLVAFWGLETNYGSFTGGMAVLDSLATLACDGRRGDYFSQELIEALHIVDDDQVASEQMRGSWAGAMGFVQFMPSIFRRYAVDHDGSGRRDLWSSTADAMASAANFLRALGWDRGYRWGREVTLPADFPYREIGRENRRPLAEWRELGVTTAWKHPLPDADIEAAILLPAGHEGPAFLVYENFDVIMGWNRSEYYALAVGHLADRINGAGDLRRSPPADAPRLSRQQIISVQKRLNAKGFISGTPDGIAGPMTRQAISHYQQANDMVPDGFLSNELLARLEIDVDESG